MLGEGGRTTASPRKFSAGGYQQSCYSRQSKIKQVWGTIVPFREDGEKKNEKEGVKPSETRCLRGGGLLIAKKGRGETPASDGKRRDFKVLASFVGKIATDILSRTNRGRGE